MSSILSEEQVERKVKPLSVSRASVNLWPVCNPLTEEYPLIRHREREREIVEWVWRARI